jgi:hypothetical protein
MPHLCLLVVFVYWCNYLTFSVVCPEEIIRVLGEKSDVNILDSGQSDEEKEIIAKSDQGSEPEE